MLVKYIETEVSIKAKFIMTISNSKSVMKSFILLLIPIAERSSFSYGSIASNYKDPSSPCTTDLQLQVYGEEWGTGFEN